jgi:hypothetical protein
MLKKEELKLLQLWHDLDDLFVSRRFHRLLQVITVRIYFLSNYLTFFRYIYFIMYLDVIIYLLPPVWQRKTFRTATRSPKCNFDFLFLQK